jgi:hypothetical protein
VHTQTKSHNVWDMIDSSVIIKDLRSYQQMSENEKEIFVFTVENISSYSFHKLNYDFVSISINAFYAKRVFVFAVDSVGKSIKLYDSGYFLRECGEPEISIGNLALIVIGGRRVIQIDEYKVGYSCCGGTHKEVINSIFVDPSNRFTRVLELNKSTIDYNNDNCGSYKSKPVSTKYSMIYLNDCNNDNCPTLSVLTYDSNNKKTIQVDYSWDSHHTKLISR